MDESKINSGFFDGLVKSKKLGLTTSFATACLGLLPTMATQVMQIALLSAAALAVVAYLVSQSIVEAAWGNAAAAEIEGEEDQVLQSPVLPDAKTTTMAAR